MEDDDRSSSADSFSLVEDHQNKADDFDDGGENHNKEKFHLKPPFQSTSKSPSIVEVAKVSYNGFVIRIFTDVYSSRNNSRCFYFEPVVLLDPSSIVRESNELLKQDLVRFKIKMWDAAIRSEVIQRLRSLPGLNHEVIHKEDVHVMPYEEVQLTVEPDSLISSIKLKSKPIRYGRLRESLNFQLECASAGVAVELAENLKKNPELFLEQWELALECRGLALGNGAKSLELSPSKGVTNTPTWIFNVSTLFGVVESDSTVQDLQNEFQALEDKKLSNYAKEMEDLKSIVLSANSRTIETSTKLEELKNQMQALGDKKSSNYDQQMEDLQDQIQAIAEKTSSTCVPVFSVENCTNPAAAKGESFGFSTSLIDAQTEHGVFDLSSGIFTVETAGTYQLNFYAHVNLDPAVSSAHQLDLKINDETVAVSYNQSASGGYQPAVISALLPLDAGDNVGIFAHRCKLYQSATFKTRFFGILLDEYPPADD